MTHRNGYRPRAWETRVGELELLIPEKRSGPAYFPSFLEPRRRCEQAIVAVVMEAYVNGVWTRKVDRLVEQLGIQGMDKDRVAACAAIWTSTSSRSAAGRWRAPTRTCGWTPSTSRSATVAAWSPRRWSSPTPSTRPAGARSSASTSARSRPRRSGSSSCALCARAAWTGCGSWSPITTRASRRRSPASSTPVAALHRALRQKHARPLPSRPARHGLRRAARGLQRPRPNRGPPTGRRGPGAPRRPAAQGRRAAGGRRGGSAGLHGVSRRPLVQAALDQPAGTRQPRDRPAAATSSGSSPTTPPRFAWPAPC